MDGKLKILFLEDVRKDAELIWREIEKNEISFTKLLVDNKKDFLEGLKSFNPEIIVSDYTLPQFDGTQALKLRNKFAPEVTFIVVTGSINEEVAVECMKMGADDYILKENLSRLGPAVINSIKKIELKNQKKAAENALSESEQRYRNLYDNAVVGLYRTTRKGKILMANKALVKMLGFQSFKELSGRNLNKSGYETSDQRKQFMDQIEKEGTIKEHEAVWIRNDGKEIFVRESARVFFDTAGKIMFFDGIVEDITDRKISEKERQESEKRIRNIFENIQDVYYETTIEGKILEVSPSIAIMSNGRYQRDGLIGKSMLEFYADSGARQSILEALMKNGCVNDFEVTLGNNKDLLINCSISAKIIFDALGSPEKIIGSMRDISQRKKAEEELNQSKKEFQNYFESAANGMSVTLPDKKWIAVNLRLTQMLGYTSEELLGLTWMSVTHPEDLVKNMNLFQQALDGKISKYETNKRLICKDGRVVYVTLSTVCEYNPDGSVHHFLSSYFDITKRVLAEEQIQQEQIMLRTLIDNLPDMIYVKDIECRKLVANIADVKNIGYNLEDEVLGKTDLELFPGETGLRGYADDKTVIDSGTAIINREEDFINKEGTRRWLVTSKLPLLNKDGKITGLVGIGHDITERKNNEAELVLALEKAEESERLKSAFLANMSHEIRTPLNAIIGFSGFLAQPDLPPEKRESFIQILDASNDQLISIINDILDISSIEANQIKLSQDLFSLDGLLDELYLTYEKQAENKGLKFICRKPENKEIIQLISDENRLRQVLGNLLNNALKFTPKGEIELGYKLNQSHIEVYVRDTGIGVAAKEQSRIFDRFSQVDSSATRTYGGNGLGLSISKAFIEKIGGKIILKSEEGKGSVFSVHLPVEIITNHQIKPKKQNTNQDLQFFAEGTILIAEDEINNFFLLNELLSEDRKTVLHAWNGQEAVDIVAADNSISMVLMDIKMPIMDGYKAMQLIKGKKPNLPVIAVSAYASSEDKKKALRAGFDNFISKPINLNTLLKILVEYSK